LAFISGILPLFGEQLEGQRTRRLVDVHVLTVRLAALDKEFDAHGPPPQADGNWLSDQIALKVLLVFPAHGTPVTTGQQQVRGEDREHGGGASTSRSPGRRDSTIA
jgi:hypothetical protein